MSEAAVSVSMTAGLSSDRFAKSHPQGSPTPKVQRHNTLLARSSLLIQS